MMETECPKSCDTFVCLPDLTSNNVVIFGKNSDRPAEEVQEIVYYPEAVCNTNKKLRCTYIEVEQVSKTAAVMLSKPAWMWGAEMGANNHGVCIGNEAIWSRLDAEKEKKLLGMDLVRLGLERSATAREALGVITNLLEKYGQGGPCSNTMKTLTYHNSYLIADPKEAWVLETVGQLWAAERVQSGHRNISNSLSIQTKIDAMSVGLKEEAARLGYWTPNTEFNFTKTFGDGDDCDRFHQGKRLLDHHSKEKKFDVKSMISILSDEKSGINRGGYEGGFGTTSSQVSVLMHPSDKPSIHWFTGTPDPCKSVFKPFVFTRGISSSVTALTKSEENENKSDYRHHLYKIHEASYRAISSVGISTRLEALQESLLAKFNCEREKSNAPGNQDLDNIFQEAVTAEIEIYSELAN